MNENKMIEENNVCYRGKYIKGSDIDLGELTQVIGVLTCIAKFSDFKSDIKGHNAEYLLNKIFNKCDGKTIYVHLSKEDIDDISIFIGSYVNEFSDYGVVGAGGMLQFVWYFWDVISKDVLEQYFDYEN